jgi:hypothetical protein
MTQSTATRSYRLRIALVSLVIGPLLMSVGDLFHPQESLDAAEQATIIAEDASYWYLAHLLLFIGMLLFIPGLLAIAGLTAELQPTAGYAGRILVLIGTAVFTGVFLCEMLIGRYVVDGADPSASTALLNSFQSGPVLAGPVGAGVVCWTVGIAIVVIALIRTSATFRWPVLLLGLGTILILAEIASAEVLLSQIGNIVILAGSVAFAWQIARSGRADIPN